MWYNLDGFTFLHWSSIFVFRSLGWVNVCSALKLKNLYIWPVCIYLYDTIPVSHFSRRERLVCWWSEALQSYCYKVGHLSHVSLHAQSRWVTAVIGIRDCSTLWWLSLLRYRISTFPAAVPSVFANAEVKKDPSSTPPLPVRNTSTEAHNGHGVSGFQRFIKTLPADLELCHFHHFFNTQKRSIAIY